MPALKRLWIRGCQNLKNIPRFDELDSLSIWDCVNLEEIHHQPAATYIFVSGTPLLRRISYSDRLKFFYVDACESLQEISAADWRGDFHISNCPFLYIPRYMRTDRGQECGYKVRTWMLKARLTVQRKRIAIAYLKTINASCGSPFITPQIERYIMRL
jgi:hypothetical protein